MLHKDYVSKKNFIINFIYFFLILSACYFFMKYAFAAFLPVFVGVLIAIITRNLLAKHFKNKVFGVITIFLFWCIVTVVFYLIFWGVIWGVIYISNSFITLKSDIFSNITQLGKKYSSFFATDIPFFKDLILNAKNSLYDFLLNITLQFGSTLASAITLLPNFILYIIVTVLTSFFTYIEYDKISCMLYKTKFFKHLKSAKYSSFLIFTKLLKAQIILFCIVFILLSIGLSILGVKFAILIALIIAIADLLPIIGLNMIMLPWGITLILMSNVSLGVSVIVLSIIVLILKEFIEPKIISDKIGISPLVILLGAYFGFLLFGAMGLILAPFVISLISVYTLNSADNCF